MLSIALLTRKIQHWYVQEQNVACCHCLDRLDLIREGELYVVGASMHSKESLFFALQVASCNSGWKI